MSSSFITTSSASQFKSEEEFVQHVFSAVSEVKEHHIFIYTDVFEPWGHAAFETLDETVSCRQTFDPYNNTLRIKVMLVSIHEIADQWIPLMVEQWHYMDQLLTQPERNLLTYTGNTTLKFTSGLYSGWTKSPDFSMQVEGHRLPCFVVESGWSEGYNKFFEDINRLIGGGTVK